MMRELIPDLNKWQQAGAQAALATVIKTWGSSPRPAGSHMAVSKDGLFCGSVSGGCVESSVIAESIEIIESGKAKRLSYGVSDQSAWEVGLACGGKIEIFIHPINWDTLSPLLDAILADQPAWYSIKLKPDGNLAAIQQPVPAIKPPLLKKTENGEILINLCPPPPQLVIVGGVNLAQPLVKLAQTLGYKTIVVDPRGAFATAERFPGADQVINAWPDEAFQQVKLTSSTAVAILSHDDKIDLPALELALNSPACYVGALGSTKTQSRRKQLLLERGVEPGRLGEIHGPIGLDLGGRATEEIALAIIAEIISEANKKFE
ncbi:MAG: XdhC family protein [Chloroflexota bacterium]